MKHGKVIYFMRQKFWHLFLIGLGEIEKMALSREGKYSYIFYGNLFTVLQTQTIFFNRKNPYIYFYIQKIYT